MRRLSVAMFAAAFCFFAAATCQRSSRAVVAIASGHEISLYDASGSVVRRIDLRMPVAGFALSPDLSKLVVVSAETEHGGALILIDVRTGSKRRLTGRHFAFNHVDSGETEVYDSPSFSPDGRRLVFAVHGNAPGDGNDAWENSGPLAVLDFDSGKPRVLEATNNIDGNGPCSESDPQWSPDGKWILFNCEDGAFLTDPYGRTLKHLKTSADRSSSGAVGWIGMRCILYVQTPESNGHFDFDHESAKLLNLADSNSSDATDLLRGFNGPKRGMIRASEDALIRQQWPTLIVETKGKQWDLQMKDPNREPQTVGAQLLTGWSARSIPSACR